MSQRRIKDLEDGIEELEAALTLKDLEDRLNIAEDKIAEIRSQEGNGNRGITVYRQYFTYRLSNARVMQITAKYFMWVPAKSDVWVVGLPGYLPSLSAKTGDGTELPILSDHELNLLFTNEDANFVTQESLRELYSEQIGAIEPEMEHSLEPNLHFVGLIIPQLGFDHFQEIILNWTEQIDSEHLDEEIFSYHVRRQHLADPTTEASTYVNITMDHKKYEIIEEPKISAHDASGNNAKIADGHEYRKILSNKTQYVYRIRRHCPLAFTIEWKIGIPKFVKRWAQAGFSISIPILLYSVISFALARSLADENSRILAGLIAMLVGFRVLLFHDTELMSRWNSLYLALLGISISIILIMQGIAKFHII